MVHKVLWKISFFPVAPHYHLLSVISRSTVAAFSKSLPDFIPDRRIQVALAVPFFCTKNSDFFYYSVIRALCPQEGLILIS